MFIKKGSYPIVEQISSRNRGFGSVQLGKSDFSVGIDKRLLINCPK